MPGHVWTRTTSTMTVDNDEERTDDQRGCRHDKPAPDWLTVTVTRSACKSASSAVRRGGDDDRSSVIRWLNSRPTSEVIDSDGCTILEWTTYEVRLVTPSTRASVRSRPRREGRLRSVRMTKQTYTLTVRGDATSSKRNSRRLCDGADAVSGDPLLPGRFDNRYGVSLHGSEDADDKTMLDHRPHQRDGNTSSRPCTTTVEGGLSAVPSRFRSRSVSGTKGAAARNSRGRVHS